MVSSFILTPILLFVIACLVSRLLRRPNTIPWADGWLPFVGHVFSFRRGASKFIESQVRKFNGMPFMVQILQRNICILSEEHIAMIQRAKDKELNLDNVFEDVFAASFIRREGDSADHLHIDLLKSKFIPKRAQFIPQFIVAANHVIERKLGSDSSKTVDDFLHSFAADIIAEAALAALCGVPLSQNDAFKSVLNEESNIGEEIIQARISGLPFFLLTNKMKKYDAPRAVIDSVLLPEIAARRKLGPENQAGDYLDALIFCEENLSDMQVIGKFTNIVFAAFSTTRNNFTEVIIDLAARPEIQERVRQEVLTQVSLNDGQITNEVITKLAFTEAVIRESMRLRVSPMIPFRRCAIDIPVPGGGVVPKGMLIGIAASSVHKSNNQFTDAMTYNPDRWLSVGSADSHRSFFSFGAGAHKCPGRLFALTEIKTLLATMLMNYKISGGSQVANMGDRFRKISVTLERRK